MRTKVMALDFGPYPPSFVQAMLGLMADGYPDRITPTMIGSLVDAYALREPGLPRRNVVRVPRRLAVRAMEAALLTEGIQAVVLLDDGEWDVDYVGPPSKRNDEGA